ncbi:MAG: hypothetical protein GY789_11090 [Hyphomicrobiales bacterium]|nr:hypothetical protein [Hyphomicrobiales bacterium]
MYTRKLRLIPILLPLVLAACASEPPPPLMSPLSEAGRYGYSDKKTGRDSYEVTYSGPSIRTGSTRAGREGDRKAAKAQTYDLALWRAAQVAIDNGYEGFDIDREDDEIEVTVRQGYYPYYRPFYYGPGRYYGHPSPYAGFYDYPSYGRYRDTSLRAVTTLAVSMKSSAADSEFDAAATAARMALKFPGTASATGEPDNEPPNVSY